MYTLVTLHTKLLTTSDNEQHVLCNDVNEQRTCNSDHQHKDKRLRDEDDDPQPTPSLTQANKAQIL